MEETEKKKSVNLLASFAFFLKTTLLKFSPFSHIFFFLVEPAPGDCLGEPKHKRAEAGVRRG